MLHRALLARVAAIALVCVPAIAAAAPIFNGSYTVTSNANPNTGLAVQTLNDFGSPLAGTTNTFANLNVAYGSVQFTDLFELFALEDPIAGNDVNLQPISVSFSFTSPSPRTGVVTGTTQGLVNLQEGLLHWSGPLMLTFSDFTQLAITLSDTSFGSSFNGIVVATFAASIPEPGTPLLIAVAVLAALGTRSFRTRSTTGTFS